MPMRPVREDVYDTAPMRPMNIRSGYEGYRRTIDRRREVIRTERPVSRRVNSRKGKKERTSGRTRYENRNSLSALIARQRSAAGKEQYFDYDLLFVIIFLMCFGLVMLYSVSFYEAQADFGNDMYYFSKQALIGVGGFIGMYLVSKLDYHLCNFDVFDGACTDSAWRDCQWRETLDRTSRQPFAAACRDYKNSSDSIYIL